MGDNEDERLGGTRVNYCLGFDSYTYPSVCKQICFEKKWQTNRIE